MHVSQHHMTAKTQDQIFHSSSEHITQAAWTRYIHWQELMKWDMPTFYATIHYQTQTSVRSPIMYIKTLPFLHSTDVVHVRQHPLRVRGHLRGRKQQNQPRNQTVAGRKPLLQPCEETARVLKQKLDYSVSIILLSCHLELTFYMISKFPLHYRKLKNWKGSLEVTFFHLLLKAQLTSKWYPIIQILEIIKADSSKHEGNLTKSFFPPSWLVSLSPTETWLLPSVFTPFISEEHTSFLLCYGPWSLHVK